MWKKIIFISLAIILLVAAFWGYKLIKERSLSEATDLYAAVASDAVLVIETKNLMNFSKTVLYENDFCKQAKEADLLSGFNSFVEKIDRLFTKEPDLQAITNRQSLLIYTLSENKEWSELIMIRSTQKEAERNIEIIAENIYPGKKTEKIKYNGTRIYVFPGEVSQQYKFACAYVDGIFLGSTHLAEVQKALDVLKGEKPGIKKDSSFVAVKATAGKNVLANVFINTQVLLPLISENINDDFSLLKEKFNTFSDWVGLDLSLSDELILVNGYSSKNTAFFTDIFDGQEISSSSFYDDLPLNTCFFTYYGISNYDLFRQKIKASQKKEVPLKSEDFVKEHFAGEVVTGYVDLYATLKQGNYVMLSIKDSTLISEQLDVIAAKIIKYSPYSYRGIHIYELPAPYKLTASFGDFVELKGQKEYAYVVGKHLLIASSPEFLTELSGLVTSGYTITKDNVFRAAKDSYDDNSTVLSYVHFPSLFKYANEIFTASFAKKMLTYQDQFSRIQTLGWQMENERGRIYHNAFIKCGSTTGTDSVFVPKKKTSRLIWSVPFDSKPVFGPVIVRNKATGADEILVQDKDHKLYFYTHEGKLVWSVQLDAPVMGNKICQVDYYKNRKYQFIFNTAKKIYLIDRKGRPVEQYPVKLSFEASAPLSVFDYENNLDYRIFIPGADKKIYLYKKDGTMPSDWAFGKTKDIVSLPVQHMKVGNDDYLFVNDGSKAYILNRKGKERIDLKSDFDISKNEFYYSPKIKDEKQAFIATDKQGYIKRIGIDGSVKSLKVSDNLSANHYFMLSQVAKSPVYIFTDNNTISVYNQDLKCVFVKHPDENDLIPCLYNDYLAIYSAESENVRVFDIKQLDEEEQNFPAESEPCVGQLKPMPNNYILIADDGKLICYELN